MRQGRKNTETQRSYSCLSTQSGSWRIGGKGVSHYKGEEQGGCTNEVLEDRGRAELVLSFTPADLFELRWADCHPVQTANSLLTLNLDCKQHLTLKTTLKLCLSSSCSSSQVHRGLSTSDVKMKQNDNCVKLWRRPLSFFWGLQLIVATPGRWGRRNQKFCFHQAVWYTLAWLFLCFHFLKMWMAQPLQCS